MDYVIYAIVDPRDHEIFYLGHTRDLERRKSQHLEGTDQISGLMIALVKESGHTPQFVVLERCPSHEAAMESEVMWIKLLKSLGARLKNSQAFTGYADRQAERRRLGAALEKLRAQRHKGNELVHIANGRGYTTRDGSGCPKKKTSSKKRWTDKDMARLWGMERKHIPLHAMARMLDRSEDSIRRKLAEMWKKRSSDRQAYRERMAES